MAISVRSGLSEEERIFTIAVDRSGADGVDGILFHGASKTGWHFDSFLEMTEVVEQIFGQMRYPEEVLKKRFFGRPRNQAAATEQKLCGEKLSRREGAAGTYLLRVRQRQNASWQGTLVNRKNRQRFVFGSFLDLVEYFDSGAVNPEMQREERYRLIIDKYLPLVLADRQLWPHVQEILPGVAVCQVPGSGGRRNTFLLRLMFLEHHACQGVLYWKEKNCQQSFRSFLELVQLIGEAVRHEEQWEETAG